MIPVHVEQHLRDWFKDDTFEIVLAGHHGTVRETKPSGRADVTCNVHADTLLIKNADNNVFRYIAADGACGKSFYRNKCADAFILQPHESNTLLYVMELKRTIKAHQFENGIMKQWYMGIYNARGIVGFLGLPNILMGNIKLYAVYRADEISNVGDSRQKTIQIQSQIHNRAVYRMWINKKVTMAIDGTNYTFPIIPIKLDDNFQAQVEI